MELEHCLSIIMCESTPRDLGFDSWIACRPPGPAVRSDDHCYPSDSFLLENIRWLDPDHDGAGPPGLRRSVPTAAPANSHGGAAQCLTWILSTWQLLSVTVTVTSSKQETFPFWQRSNGSYSPQLFRNKKRNDSERTNPFDLPAVA